MLDQRCIGGDTFIKGYAFVVSHTTYSMVQQIPRLPWINTAPGPIAHRAICDATTKL